VWEVVETVQANDGSIAEAATYLEVDPVVVERAVRYYGSHREEIDAWIARVHEIADEEECKWLSAREALGEAPSR
jgi:hypothetical protein